MKKLNQKGFHIAELLIVLIVLSMIVLVGFGVLNKKKDDIKTVNDGSSNKQTSQKSDTIANITWQWDESKSSWSASGKPPACPDPLKFTTAPSDLSKAISVLYPGQTRGGNYKPHGGIGFDSTTNDISVKAIMDGKVTSGSRYIEAGEVQYMFWIQNDCGVAYRFDHLLALAPEFQAVADKLPEAKVDDSRTTNFESPISIKAGDTIATAVGFKNNKNVAYDLGIYDLRKPNAKGSTQAYRDAHKFELSQAAYALCWFNMFSPADSAKLINLPSRDASQGKTSDYCK